MNKTKIEWCDSTWNPITGCKHNCAYCFAANQARRFGGYSAQASEAAGTLQTYRPGKNDIHILDAPLYRVQKNGKAVKAPFPLFFEPTMHRHRLGDPAKIKTPQTVFVVDMGDLFGEWMPDALIEHVFKACAAAPQHRYLFLTKNPGRYLQLAKCKSLPYEHYYGYTLTGAGAMPETLYTGHRIFASVEPLLKEPEKKFLDLLRLGGFAWVIVGAETGNRKGKVIPRREWIEAIVEQCRASGVPVFLKNNLAPIWGGPLIQEYPWEREG